MASLRCCDSNHSKHKLNEDGCKTESSVQQIKVEESVQQLYDFFNNKVGIDPESPLLRRESHIPFLKKGLSHLSESYQCLDASRPWLCYWILHSLYLLNEPVSDTVSTSVVNFLKKCQHANGGFGGGPDQIAHLAPTYAAVNALCILGTDEAYKAIDREKMYLFLNRLKMPEGCFRMHDCGEIDIRGTYCALAVARLVNIFTDELFENCAEWILSCQTYEGGFGGVPGMEAHGGYTFCGFAALVMLRKEHLVDMKLLLRWAVNRQMRYEGGFQGRTNKLVDGCYSFWQGGIFPLLHRALAGDGTSTLSMEKWLFHQGALQEYLLICCQYPSGGLIDKPGKHRDFYHTCYTLSGLSVAQHFAGGKLGATNIIGDSTNELLQTHPIYNIGVDVVANAYSYFHNCPVPTLNNK